MKAGRSVAAVHSAIRGDIGALVTRVALPHGRARHLDPYLLLAHHGPQSYPANEGGMPFGAHPHRGFETVTFIRKGALAHGDAGRNGQIVHAGGIQWMTAGSGIVHDETVPAEYAKEDSELEMLQLWVNLPARLKMTPPRFSGIEASGIPVVPFPDGAGELHLVAGHYLEATGPVHPLTGVFMSLVTLNEGMSITLPAPAARNVLLYAIEGSGRVADAEFSRWDLIEMNGDSDSLTIGAASATHLLFSHADPIGEPIVAQGPFVMNSNEEIAAAVRDYQAGRFAMAEGLPAVGE